MPMTGPAPFSFGTFTNVPRGVSFAAGSAYIYDWFDDPWPPRAYPTLVAGANNSPELEVLFANNWTYPPNLLVTAGDTLRLRHFTGYGFSETRTTTISINGVQGSLTTTTEARDATPNTVWFDTVNNAAAGSPYISAPVQITGINDQISISVSGTGSPTLIFNGGMGFTPSGPSGKVVNGDYVQIQLTASSSPGGSVSANISSSEGWSNGGSAFTVNTTPPDTTPNQFTFTGVSNQTVSTLVTSNTVTMTGMDPGYPASVSFSTSGGGSGHQYSKNGGAWTSLGATTVVNGDTLAVRFTTSASAGTAGNITVNVNGVADTYTATTTTADTTPDPFTFVDQPAVQIGTVATSNVITIKGIDGAASVSFSTSGGSSHQYSKNGGAWTAVGATTVVLNDTLQVRHTVSGTPAQAASTTMTVGGVSDTFNTTSANSDTTPDQFYLTDITGAQIDSDIVSNAITVAGINASTAISASGGGVQWRKNGGAWQSSAGTVVVGDTVELLLKSAKQYVTQINSVLTIGGVSDTWSVTTRSPQTTSQYVRTFRETVYGVSP